MNGPRIAKLGILILAALVISFLVHTGDRDKVEATSFDLINPAVLSDLNPSAPGDITTAFTLPEPDANFAGVVTFLPPEFVLSTSVPIGDTVGELRSISNLGFFLGSLGIGPCGGGGTRVNFRLDAGAVDPLVDGIVDPLPAGASSRMQPMFDDDGDFNNNGTTMDTGDPYFESGTGVPGDATNANGIPDGLDRVPTFYNIFFDFDLDGNPGDGNDNVDANEIPFTRSTGFTLVSTETVMISLITFDVGQLLNSPTSPGNTFVPEMGFPSLVVLTPPDPTVKPSPSPVTDFCSPVRTSTTACGQTDPTGFDEQESFSFGCSTVQIDHRYDRTNSEDGAGAGTCSDGIENAGGDTTRRDFDDPDCYDVGVPFEVFDPANDEDGAGLNSCSDGIDNVSGGADQADSDCYDAFPGTDHKFLHAFVEDATLPGANSPPTCSDGLDNTSDGKRDFEERDCYEAVKSLSDGTQIQGPAVLYDPTNSEDGGAVNSCSDDIDNGGGDEDADGADNIDQDDKDCYDGAGGPSVAVRNNPSTPGSYALRSYGISGRDSDNDGVDTGLDACPLTADNDGDSLDEDLSDNNRDGIPDGFGTDPTPWDPRRDSLVVGDSDSDGIPNGCDPTPGFNTGFVGDHDGDGFKNTQDNCESVPNPFNTAGSVTSNVDPAKAALDIPLGHEAPDLGPLSDHTGAACDDSDNDGSEDGFGPGTCNDGIDNGSDGPLDGNDLDCSANEGTGSSTVDGTCDDGIDNDGFNGIDSADPLCQGPQTGGGADDTGVDLVDTDDDQDGIPDTSDDTPAIPAGHFHKVMTVQPVCIGLADSDGDGWCDVTETALGSDGSASTGNAAEEGAECDNNSDDDGDGIVNDGCPVRGLIAEAGSQCTNATNDDTPQEDIDETILQLPAGEGINDGCPPVGPGQPEDASLDFYLDPVAQSCNDGIDNDGDGLMDFDDDNAVGDDTTKTGCQNADPDGDSLEAALGAGAGDPFGLFMRDEVELFIGTAHRCAVPRTTTTNDEVLDRFGPDFDDSGDVDGSDVFLFAQRFSGVLPYIARFDIYPTAASLGTLDGSDVFVLATYFNIDIAVELPSAPC